MYFSLYAIWWFIRILNKQSDIYIVSFIIHCCYKEASETVHNCRTQSAVVYIYWSSKIFISHIPAKILFPDWLQVMTLTIRTLSMIYGLGNGLVLACHECTHTHTYTLTLGCVFSSLFWNVFPLFCQCETLIHAYIQNLTLLKECTSVTTLTL